MRTLAVVSALVVASPAFADRSDLEIELEQLIAFDSNPPPKFAFSNGDFYTTNVRRPSIGGMQNGETAVVSKAVVATTADGSVAWIAGDITVGCDKAASDCTPGIGTPLHATGLLQKSGKEWQWVTWHITETTTAKEQAASSVVPKALPRAVAGAEDVAKLFETSLADPKALVASVSNRKDVVLYGSTLAERVVGGAKVKAKLKSWNLSFKPRDGIQAGAVGTSVAWVAANVDAVSTKTKDAKASPYRVLAVYEKTGSAWALVQVHFSVDRAN